MMMMTDEKEEGNPIYTLVEFECMLCEENCNHSRAYAFLIKFAPCNESFMMKSFSNKNSLFGSVLIAFVLSDLHATD